MVQIRFDNRQEPRRREGPMIQSFAVLLGLGIGGVCFADAPVEVPKEKATSAEIYKAFGSSVGYGPVNSAELRSHGRELLAIWYCPTSGEAACYLHAWYFDPAKSKWALTRRASFSTSC
jgi:hypothetical protein